MYIVNTFVVMEQQISKLYREIKCSNKILLVWQSLIQITGLLDQLK